MDVTPSRALLLTAAVATLGCSSCSSPTQDVLVEAELMQSARLKSNDSPLYNFLLEGLNEKTLHQPAVGGGNSLTGFLVECFYQPPEWMPPTSWVAMIPLGEAGQGRGQTAVSAVGPDGVFQIRVQPAQFYLVLVGYRSRTWRPTRYKHPHLVLIVRTQGDHLDHYLDTSAACPPIE